MIKCNLECQWTISEYISWRLWMWAEMVFRRTVSSDWGNFW